MLIEFRSNSKVKWKWKVVLDLECAVRFLLFKNEKLKWKIVFIMRNNIFFENKL